VFSSSSPRCFRLDPEVSENHGYNRTVNSATETYKPKQSIKNGKSGPGPSIKYNSRELNPGRYVLSNTRVIIGVLQLYMGLVYTIGHEDFDYQVTGGDRYVGAVSAGDNGVFDERVYSSTNHSQIYNSTSGSSHVRGASVDLRIKWYSGIYIPLDIVRPVIRDYTDFMLYPGALPENYPNDNHYHLKLRNE